MKCSCTNCGLDQEANDADICVRCGEVRLVEVSIITASFGYAWKDFLPAKWVELNKKIDRAIKDKKRIPTYRRIGNC